MFFIIKHLLAFYYLPWTRLCFRYSEISVFIELTVSQENTDNKQVNKQSLNFKFRKVLKKKGTGCWVGGKGSGKTYLFV